MAKVLKITKQDKTIHIAPLSQEPFLTAYNKRLPADKKLKMETIEEEEAKNLPYIDESYVNAGEAQKKAAQLMKDNEAKDLEIEALKKQLAEKNAGSGDNGSGKQKTAVEVISLIKAATKAEDIESLVAGDERATVKAAAAEAIEALKK